MSNAADLLRILRRLILVILNQYDDDVVIQFSQPTFSHILTFIVILRLDCVTCVHSMFDLGRRQCLLATIHAWSLSVTGDWMCTLHCLFQPLQVTLSMKNEKENCNQLQWFHYQEKTEQAYDSRRRPAEKCGSQRSQGFLTARSRQSCKTSSIKMTNIDDVYFSTLYYAIHVGLLAS